MRKPFSSENVPPAMWDVPMDYEAYAAQEALAKLLVPRFGDVAGLKIGTDDVMFTCLPLFHSNAQVLNCYPAMLAGARIQLSARYSSTNFWREVTECGATILNTVSAMNYFIGNTPEGEYDRALRDHDEAIRLDPKDASAYNNRGTSWRSRGDHARAIANEICECGPLAVRAIKEAVLRGRELSLEDGLRDAYQWFLANQHQFRG